MGFDFAVSEWGVWGPGDCQAASLRPKGRRPAERRVGHRSRGSGERALGGKGWQATDEKGQRGDHSLGRASAVACRSQAIASPTAKAGAFVAANRTYDGKGLAGFVVVASGFGECQWLAAVGTGVIGHDDLHAGGTVFGTMRQDGRKVPDGLSEGTFRGPGRGAARGREIDLVRRW